MEKLIFCALVIVSSFLTGCIGPSLFANRSHVEFYNATTEGRAIAKHESSPISVDGGMKEYDVSSSLAAGKDVGSASSENKPSNGESKGNQTSAGSKNDSNAK